MSETSIDTMRNHHPVPPLPEGDAPPPAAGGAPTTSRAAAPPKARDICERMPLLARPQCRLNGALGLNPSTKRTRPPSTSLERAAADFRHAAPAKARESAAAKVADATIEAIDAGHNVTFATETVSAGMARAAALLGPLSGLGAFVKFNLEQSRANRDGNLAARAHATAAGFAKVLASTMADGQPRGVARRPDLWPVPAFVANRYDEDYRRGVRVALDTVAKYRPEEIATMQRDLERATPNVTPQAGDTPRRLLERRLAVYLGGYVNRADLRF